jgi:predicted RNA-binding Zn-ribbon protein involved in translation (DUF1610 family)
MLRTLGRHRDTLRATAIAAPIALFAGGAWFLVTSRVVRSWGPDSAAPAAGALVALVVAATIWRWARTDEEQIALASTLCPRCGDALDVRHEHSRAGALAHGLTEWLCTACGYEHSEALTCELCAP